MMNVDSITQNTVIINLLPNFCLHVQIVACGTYWHNMSLNKQTNK